MKRICTGIALLAMLTMSAVADVEKIAFTGSVIGEAVGCTNASTYVIRGVIESVYVDIAVASTGTVTIADDYGTVFTKSITADGQYFPRAAAHTTAGAALSWTELASTPTGAVTNTVTTTYFGEKIATAGPVTVTYVQTGAIGDVATNSYSVTVLYSK